MKETTTENTPQESKFKTWFKRLGFAGFMFFFLKGMVWVAIFVISYIWGPEALTAISDFFTDLF